MRDKSLDCLNLLIALFEEMLCHDGYGDISVRIGHAAGNARQVTIRAGKEYRFLALPRCDETGRPARPRFRVVQVSQQRSSDA